MDARFLFRGVENALSEARKALLVTHKRPDGDTLGSAAAFLNFCLGRGVEAAVFCLDPVPEQFHFLPGIDRFTDDPAVFQDGSFDIMVVFDAGDLRHAGVAELVAAMRRRPFTVVFDHHATNERFADISIVDPTASSTAEIVHRFFLACELDVTSDQATCLLTGIFSDTDSFTNPATSESALRAASYLIGRGANIQTISSRLTHNRSVPALRLWGQVFSRLKFDDRLGVASTAVFCADCRGIDSEQIEGIANFLGNFLEAKAILVLKELPRGLVKGSLRTAENIDVSAIAKTLGGGGHKKAAGFTIPGRIVEAPACWRVE